MGIFFYLFGLCTVVSQRQFYLAPLSQPPTPSIFSVCLFFSDTQRTFTCVHVQVRTHKHPHAHTHTQEDVSFCTNHPFFSEDTDWHALAIWVLGSWWAVGKGHPKWDADGVYALHTNLCYNARRTSERKLNVPVEAETDLDACISFLSSPKCRSLITFTAWVTYYNDIMQFQVSHQWLCFFFPVVT